MGAEAPRAGGRRACWRWRRRWPRPASSRRSASPFSAGREAPRRPSARRSTASRSPRWPSSPALCLLAGILPGLVIDALAPGRRRTGRRPHAGAGRASPGCRSCRSPKAAAPITACWSSSSSRLRRSMRPSSSTASRRGRVRRAPAWDCGFPDPSPGDAIYRRQLRPADPPRLRHAVFRRRRDGRHAAARRHAAGALHARPCATWSGRCLYQPIARRRRRRRRSAQPAAVPHHPPLSEPRLRRPGRAAAGAGAMAMIVDARRPGRADGAGARAGAAAHRLRAQGQGAAAAPAGAVACFSPIAICCGCCARRSCWPRTPPGCSARRPI